MTKPLALVYYENLLPGSQLVNRLQDLEYRVQVVAEPAMLERVAEAERALVIVVELASTKADMQEILRHFRENPATQHIPVLAFTSSREKKRPASPEGSGATIVASDAAILSQLPQLLEQALAVE
jgi:CheY-like chemotaxis protein